MSTRKVLEGVNISEAHTLFANGQMEDIPVPQVFGALIEVELSY
jgi:hypothetical protein